MNRMPRPRLCNCPWNHDGSPTMHQSQKGLLAASLHSDCRRFTFPLFAVNYCDSPIHSKTPLVVAGSVFQARIRY
jgi:hypothetical protein